MAGPDANNASGPSLGDHDLLGWVGYYSFLPRAAGQLLEGLNRVPTL